MVAPSKNLFGTLLRKQRRAAKKPLRELAALLKCSVTYVADVERGDRAPFDTGRIRLLAEFLGTSFAGLADAAALVRGSVTIASEHTAALVTASHLARVLAETKPEKIEYVCSVIRETLHRQMNQALCEREARLAAEKGGV